MCEEDLLISLSNILDIVCNVIVLMLPWMILAAIRSVRKSVEEASERRTYEARKILSALGTLHDDIVGSVEQ